MTSALDELASASGQKEQALNIILAQKIAAGKDRNAIDTLIGGLSHKVRAIRHDCIKTLYEAAAISPTLLAPYAPVFLQLLDDKDNRMQWGGMTALSALAAVAQAPLYESLGKIIAVAATGSVITRDHAVRILAALSENDHYKAITLPLLTEQLLQAPPNQVPSYAEQILPVTDAAHRSLFEKALRGRLQDIAQDSKRKRVEKVLKKLAASQS